MAHSDTTLNGDVTDIFAHRFVVATREGKILADLGPEGVEQVALKVGDHVTLTGEMKPSELKVRTIQLADRAAISLAHKKPQPRPHEDDVQPDADPREALKTAERNGLKVVGGPRRKPRHFEVLGQNDAGEYVELHVEFDGTLRKTKPADQHEPKWAQ